MPNNFCSARDVAQPRVIPISHMLHKNHISCCEAKSIILTFLYKENNSLRSWFLVQRTMKKLKVSPDSCINCNTASYKILAPCEPQINNMLVWLILSQRRLIWLGVNCKTWSEIIWPTCSPPGKTLGNQQKIFLANFDAILLASQGTVSDSCKYMDFFNIHQAITIGKDTYHHLQKITSILYFKIKYIAINIQMMNLNKSIKLRIMAFIWRSLLTFQDKIDRK